MPVAKHHINSIIFVSCVPLAVLRSCVTQKVQEVAPLWSQGWPKGDRTTTTTVGGYEAYPGIVLPWMLAMIDWEWLVIDWRSMWLLATLCYIRVILSAVLPVYLALVCIWIGSWLLHLRISIYISSIKIKRSCLINEFLDPHVQASFEHKYITIVSY